MLTPENDKGPLEPKHVRPGTVEPSDACLSRVNTPLRERLTQVAQRSDVSLGERNDLVRILLAKGPSAQKESTCVGGTPAPLSLQLIF